MTEDDFGTVIWTGKQWRVTTTGIEDFSTAKREPYRLDIEDLQTGYHDVSASMMVHVVTKNWVDADDFIQAYLIACVVHGVRLPNAGQAVDEARKMKAAVTR